MNFQWSNVHALPLLRASPLPCFADTSCTSPSLAFSLPGALLNFSNSCTMALPQGLPPQGWLWEDPGTFRVSTLITLLPLLRPGEDGGQYGHALFPTCKSMFNCEAWGLPLTSPPQQFHSSFLHCRWVSPGPRTVAGMGDLSHKVSPRCLPLTLVHLSPVTWILQGQHGHAALTARGLPCVPPCPTPGMRAL